MRIVSGMARGLCLKTVPGEGVRPTTDRVKETLFAVLGDLTGSRVVDLFSGSGALGLEAFSRGAEQVVMVEQDPRHCRVIEANLRHVQRAMPAGCVATARLVRGNAFQVRRLLPEWHADVDLVLADPPYEDRPGLPTVDTWLTDPAFAAWAGTALLVLEHHTSSHFSWHPNGPWQRLKHRRFGTTTLSFAEVATPPVTAAASGEPPVA